MKIYKSDYCYLCIYFLQVAEIVQTIDELVTFTKNLTPGSESLKKQVDSRSEELTNPSLAATLKDEAKKVFEEEADNARSSSRHCAYMYIVSVFSMMYMLYVYALELLMAINFFYY